MTPDGKYLVVADGDSDQATVIDVAGRSARHVSVGYSPAAGYLVRPTRFRGQRGYLLLSTGMVITGSTAVVLDTYGGQVSLFSTKTRHVYPPITVGDFPGALAITA